MRSKPRERGVLAKDYMSATAGRHFCLGRQSLLCRVEKMKEI